MIKVKKDKRKFRRAPINVEVSCSELSEQERKGKGSLFFFSRDISAGGVFLETSVPLEVGSVIYLKFTLPDSTKKIVAQAKVVRVSAKYFPNTKGMGIEFVEVNENDIKMIEEYVKKNILE